MTTGEKNLEGLQPMVKPMWLPLHWASEQAGFMGCPHYQWLLSHKLLSLSDNLFSCLIVFSFLFLFLIFFTFSVILSRFLLWRPSTWSLPGTSRLIHLCWFQMKNWSHGPEGFWATLTRNSFSLCSWMTASLMVSSTSCESDISYHQILLGCLSLGGGRCFSPTMKGNFQLKTEQRKPTSSVATGHYCYFR